jgi:hypothetical protein
MRQVDVARRRDALAAECGVATTIAQQELASQGGGSESDIAGTQRQSSGPLSSDINSVNCGLATQIKPNFDGLSGISTGDRCARAAPASSAHH